MRIEMTRRVQMPPLGSEFDDFLYAPIGKDSNETPLSSFSVGAIGCRSLGGSCPISPVAGGHRRSETGFADRRATEGVTGLSRPCDDCSSLDRAPHAPVKAYLMYYAVVIATVLISQWPFPSRPASTKVDSAPVSESGAASPRTPRPSSRQ